MSMLSSSKSSWLKEELNQFIKEVEQRAQVLHDRWHNTSLAKNYNKLCVSDLLVVFGDRLQEIQDYAVAHNLHAYFNDIVVSHIKNLKRNSNDFKSSSVIGVLNQIFVSKPRSSFDQTQFEANCGILIDHLIRDVRPILQTTDSEVKEALKKVFVSINIDNNVSNSDLLKSLQAVLDQQEAFKVMLKMVKQTNPIMTDVNDIIRHARTVFYKELEIASGPLLSNVTRIHAPDLYIDFNVTKITANNYQAYLQHFAQLMSSKLGIIVSDSSLEEGLEYKGKVAKHEFERIERLELIRQNQDAILPVLVDLMEEQSNLNPVEALNVVCVNLNALLKEIALADPLVKAIVSGVQEGRREQDFIREPRPVNSFELFDEFAPINALIHTIADNYYPGEDLVPQKYTDFMNDFKTVLGGEPFNEVVFNEKMQKIDDNFDVFIEHLLNSRELDPNRAFTEVIDLAFQNFIGNYQYVVNGRVDSNDVHGFRHEFVPQQELHLG